MKHDLYSNWEGYVSGYRRTCRRTWHLSIHPLTHPSTYPSMHLSMYPSMRPIEVLSWSYIILPSRVKYDLYSNWEGYVSGYRHICRRTRHLLMHLLTHLSTHLSTHSSMHLSIYPSMRPTEVLSWSYIILPSRVKYDLYSNWEGYVSGY